MYVRRNGPKTVWGLAYTTTTFVHPGASTLSKQLAYILADSN